jgi:prepilin-type processing-associated H-X9-DG protein
MEHPQEIALTLPIGDAYLEIETAPNLPQAITTVVRYSPKGEALRILHLLDERGRLQGSFTAPKEWLMNTVVWTQKGEIALMGFVKSGNEKPRQQWFQLQKSTLQIQPLAEKPTIAEEIRTVVQHTEGLHVRVQKEPVPEGENEGSDGKLWLEGDPRNKNTRVLVSGDSGRGELNILGEQVIYHSQGALFAAPLLKTDKATLLALLRNRKKMVAISNAKQLGLGLMMYAQDNNETFPSGDPNEKISPYLKNPSIFDGFNYTFGGGPLGDITNPSQTELGYVQGDGGRAYLYADGHVRWRDD